MLHALRASAFLLLPLAGLACSSDEEPSAPACQIGANQCDATEACVNNQCINKVRLDCTSGGSDKAVLKASALQIEFGIIEQSEVTRDLRLENAGDCTLELYGAEIEGGSSLLSCDQCNPQNYPQKVYPGHHFDIRLSVLPSTPGNLDETLKIESNDEANSSLRIKVLGRYTGAPKPVVSHQSIDFGYVPVGQNAVELVQVINKADGDANLTVTKAEIVPSSAEFSVQAMPPLPAEILPVSKDARARLALAVRFSPTEVKLHQAQLVITYSSGETAEVSLAGQEDAPSLQVNTQRIELGMIRLGNTVRRGITLQNTGKAPLLAKKRFQSGTHPDLALPQRLPAEIPPGGLFELVVEYTATLVGTVQDEIIIESNDPMRPSVRIPVIGSAFADAQEVVSLELVFPNDSDSLLDLDLRDVDLILENPAGQVCSEKFPMPTDWGVYGRPQWSAIPPKENPERILLTQTMMDGTYVVSLNYVEDCATLPTALTASLLGIGTDALVDELSEGEVNIDPMALDSAIQQACLDHRSAPSRIRVTVNGMVLGMVEARPSQKGDLIRAFELVRTNGRFSIRTN